MVLKFSTKIMSSPTELDLAVFEELQKKYQKPSETSNQISTPSLSAAIFLPSNSSSAVCFKPSTCLSSTSNNLKRSFTSKSDGNNEASKFKKLDVIELTQTSELENFEDAALFAEYVAQEEDEPPFLLSNDEEDNDEDEEEVERSPDDVDIEVDMIKCNPCAPQKNIKSTDDDLKHFAFNMPLMSHSKCGSECKFGGNCVQETTIKDMEEMVIDFWNDYDCDAPSAATRRLRIIQILRSAVPIP